jgi:hypothetical protein
MAAQMKHVQAIEIYRWRTPEQVSSSPMRRRSFKFLSAVAIFLSLATVAQWVRGRYGGDVLRWGEQDSTRATYVVFAYDQWGLGTTSVPDLGLQYQHIADPSESTERHAFFSTSGFAYFRSKTPMKIGIWSWPIRNEFVGVEVSRALPSALPGNPFGGRLANPGDFMIKVDYRTTLIALLSLPAAYFVARRVRSKSATGCCASCGYDLRASPDRCPECGTTVGGKGI